MDRTIRIEKEKCVRCGKCVKVCPATIFVQEDVKSDVKAINEASCIACGHCVAVCPESAIAHSDFPAGTVHPIDYAQLPTPEQLMLLCKSRRSNRTFTTKPIPKESLNMILEAAHRAPTGSNAQHVRFLVVSHPEQLRKVIEFTVGVFSGVVGKLKNPLLKPFLKMAMPEAYKYLPTFERMKADYENGADEILRKATAVIFFYTPKRARMGVMDANLAYQNGSLMAESLGVSQFYTGFVLNACLMKKGKLEALLGIDGEITAGMALGMPSLRFPNYIDRNEIDVKTI